MPFEFRDLMITFLPIRGAALDCGDGCSECCTVTPCDPSCDGGTHPDCTMGTDKEDLGRLRPEDLVTLRTLVSQAAERVELRTAAGYALARLDAQAVQKDWRSLSAREINAFEEKLDAALKELMEKSHYRTEG